MDQLAKEVENFRKEFESSFLTIDGTKLTSDYAEMQQNMARPDFWSDPSAAQEVSKKFSKLERRIKPWLDMKLSLESIGELLSLSDKSIETDIRSELTVLQNNYSALKEQLKYSGPYDDRAVIITISAGAGGTDAMDWAEMLERMYLRFCERHGFSVEIIDRSPSEEAGIKSVSLEIDGPFAFAKLKSEHGVHRLVRLSPFNADSLRQTSFAKVEAVPVIDEPSEIDLDEKDLKIDVYRSGGKGGQSVNTTDSAVRITHIPTGIVVAIQNERSQLQNKEKALQIVRSKLAQLKLEQHKERISELKGPNEQAAWGNQIRNYVLHPYKLVKDTRTGHETTDTDAVLDGDIDSFIDAYLEHSLGS